jgi:uncharacterized membrane protein YcaP (DUF421 family)
LDENLAKANVSRDELIAKLHEANALNFDQVLALFLETTGDMSLLHTTEDKMLLLDMLQEVRGIPNEYQNNYKNKFGEQIAYQKY